MRVKENQEPVTHSVRKADDALEILAVDRTEQIGDGERVGGVPDVVDDAPVARRVVGERELADRVVRGSQLEPMRDALGRVPAVYMIHEAESVRQVPQAPTHSS